MENYTTLYHMMLKDPVWEFPSETRVCLMAVLSIAARDNGRVDAAYSHIAHISGVSVLQAKKAFESFEQLPKTSHFRLIREGTIWYMPGLKRMDRILATGSAEHRPLRSTSRGIGGYVYYAVQGNRVKIGFSMNPWSRVMEIAKSVKGTKLVAYERGTYAKEKFRHRQFESCNIHGEWFQLNQELSDHINSIKATKSTSK